MDGDSLKQLASSLGECSKIVSQIITAEQPTNGPNRTTSGSTVDNNTVENTVGRARSMLQQSTLSGLCSRLNQRERLRASTRPNPPATADSGAKKSKRNEEQQKPFEFALMQCEDEDDGFMITSNNIILRGFINVMTTDGESNIRAKIGEAIRLKYPLVNNNDFVFLRANRRKLSIPVTSQEYSYKQVKLLAGQGAIYIKMKDGLNCLFQDEGKTASDDEIEEILSKPTFSEDELSKEPAEETPKPMNLVTSEEIEKRESSFKGPLESVAQDCVNYCKSNDITNPVEILRYSQSRIVTGRPLDVQDLTVSQEGDTTYILINRYDVLNTALEEVKLIENPRVTLEVSFYGESAQDYGGPRREFFRICLQEIKAKYFDHGLREHLADDYTTVGLIMALSILQNGAIPRFLKEEDLQALFSLDKPSNPCLAKLQNGFDMLGLCQIGNCLPIFLHLFRDSPIAALTRRKLISVLQPKFSEEDCNARNSETEIYNVFAKYTRKAASGQRGSVTLEHILQFVTGSDVEPPLGFAVHPCIEFVDATGECSSCWSYLPTANTCANTLYIPKCSKDSALPGEEELFKAYDCAFVILDICEPTIDNYLVWSPLWYSSVLTCGEYFMHLKTFHPPKNMTVKIMVKLLNSC